MRDPGRWGWALLAALACGNASAAACEGVVRASGNPGQDAGGTAVQGARVSDGVRIAVTDAQGRYRLDAAPGRPVFLVKPAGYWLADSRDAWRPPGQCGDFALGDPEANLAWTSPARILVVADPQPKSPEEVEHFRRDVAATVHADFEARFAIVPRHGRVLEGGPGLGLVLGDIAHDDPTLYPAMAAALGAEGTPWLFAPGNHDADLGATSDAGSLGAYTRHFGPDTYAWEEHGAAFVMLDDVIVRPDADTEYVGGLREDQFAFLEAYLPTVPTANLLVVGVHIPLFESPGRDTFRDADRARLFALLARFPHVLVLSGHGHVQRHHFHDAATGWHGAAPLHEYNVGAASGAFWSGVADAAGIPDATMADGTPNGHAVLHLLGQGRYALDWRPARVHADDPLLNAAMALHAPRVLRRGSWPGQAVHANVFMGLGDTRVEYRIDGGPWQPMQRVQAPDPRVVAENVRDDEATHLRARERAPQAAASTHLWRGPLPTDLPPGEHRIEVRAFDRWMGVRGGRTSYELVE